MRIKTIIIVLLLSVTAIAQIRIDQVKNLRQELDGLRLYADSLFAIGLDSSGISKALSDSLDAVRAEFYLALAEVEIDVDSISITYTPGDPPKLQVSVTWLDGRVDSLVQTYGYFDEITYPDGNTISFGGDSIKLDPATLEIDDETGTLTVVGGTGGSVGNADSLANIPAANYALKEYVNQTADSIRNEIPDSSQVTNWIGFDISDEVVNDEILRYLDGKWVNVPLASGGSVGNADSLGSIPASGYALKTYVNQTADSLRDEMPEALTEEEIDDLITAYNYTDSSGTSGLISDSLEANNRGWITADDIPEIPSIDGLASETYVNETADSIRNEISDSVKTDKVLVNTDGSIVIENDTDPPATIEYVGSIGGEGGIRVVETVQVSGDSPSFGFHRDGNVSDIVPPSPMTGLWDWALPNKSGTIALLDDVPDSSQIDSWINAIIDSMGSETSQFTMEQIDSVVNFIRELFTGGATGQMLYKNSDSPYDLVWNAAPEGGSGDTTHLVAFNNVIGLQDTVNKFLEIGDSTLYATQTDLTDGLAAKANTSHSHAISDITALQDTLNKFLEIGDSTIYATQTDLEAILNEGDPRVPYMWVYLALDTIPSLESFTPVGDAGLSEVVTSNVIGVNDYDVSYVSISGAVASEYRTKTGETWSGWELTTQLLKAVDSAQVRLTSSDEFETAVACTLLIGGQDEIFTVTTVAEVLPDAPTDFIAVGGESETEIPMTWTDAEGDIDSVRVYEGSTNDTTAFTWIASVAQGTEAYNRTGREAETTYWYSVKSYDGSNESYFAPPDSATTLAGGGGSYPTDSLYEFWDADDLSNGSVTTWAGQIVPLSLGLWTSGVDPEKTNDGVVFDSTDWMYVANSKNFTEASISWTGTIVDTSEYQILVGIRASGSQLLTLQLHTNGTIGVRATLGVEDDVFYEVRNGGIINTTANIICTYNGDGTVKVYVNGVERGMVSAYLSLGVDNERVEFATAVNGVAEGTIYNEVMIYTKELTSQEVSDLWDYIEDKYGL